MVLQKKEIDFDWAYCQLLALDHDAISELLQDMYPEVFESNEFVVEDNVASTHRQILDLRGIATDLESQLSEFSSSPTKSEAIKELATFFTELEENRVAAIAELIENNDVEIVESGGELSFYHQFLPLFFNVNLKSKTDAIIANANHRDFALKAFQRALRDAGRTLPEVKAAYRKENEAAGDVMFLAPFDKEFALAEKRFHANKNKYLTPVDIEDVTLDVEEEQTSIEIEILKQSIIGRQIYKAGAIVEVSQEQAESLVELGKAKFTENDENIHEFLENEQDDESDSRQAPQVSAPWQSLEERTRPANNATLSKERTSTWKYVQAWVLASLLSGVATTLLDLLLAEVLIGAGDVNLTAYWIISPLLSALVWLACVIFVYSKHPTLKIRRVVPWVWGLGTIGILAGIGNTLGDLPIIFYVVTVAAYGFAFFKFGDFFKQYYVDRY